MISICIYIKGRSSCKKATILYRHVGAQNMDLLGFGHFTLIPAGIRKV